MWKRWAYDLIWVVFTQCDRQFFLQQPLKAKKFKCPNQYSCFSQGLISKALLLRLRHFLDSNSISSNCFSCSPLCLVYSNWVMMAFYGLHSHSSPCSSFCALRNMECDDKWSFFEKVALPPSAKIAILSILVKGKINVQWFGRSCGALSLSGYPFQVQYRAKTRPTVQMDFSKPILSLSKTGFMSPTLLLELISFC